MALQETTQAVGEEEDDSATVSCIKSHFEEHNEFMKVLRTKFCVETATGHVQSQTGSVKLTSVAHTADQELAYLAVILERYQEQPHLLDSHLETVVEAVIEPKLKEHIYEGRFVPGFTRYFSFLYLLTKVRGYKHVVKHFTHEAADLEPLVAYLQTIDGKRFDFWEVRYIVLLWMSLAARIPFDLSRLDTAGEQQTLTDKIITICKPFLASSTKENDAAAECLARLLTRSDAIKTHLPQFIKWAVSSPNDHSSSINFHFIGVLSTMAKIFKYGPREITRHYSDQIIPFCTDILAGKMANNSLIRKLSVKLVQRVGLSFLKPRIASWRYKRGNRVLDQTQAQSTTSAADAAHQHQRKLCENDMQQGNEDEIDVPGELEEIIELLMTGLQDKDTIVRWTSSKGLGRITERLPRDFAIQIVHSLVDLFQADTFINSSGNMDLSVVSDQAWHGACLSTAELARRGLLLPAELPTVVQWIIKALTFDQIKGNFSIGAHVRDAACYVCWSFARAYEAQIMAEHIEELGQVLVSVSVFDREVSVRRAASAAFQEIVGRQGNVEHGIDIITLANYFSIGTRKTSFADVSIAIAGYPKFRKAFIEHLLNFTVFHWHQEMRELSSKALHHLTLMDFETMVDNVLPKLLSACTDTNLNTRHGALLAVAEICLAWSERCLQSSSEWFSDPKRSKLISEVCEFMPIICRDYPSFFTNFGSHTFLGSFCRFVSCVALARMPLTESQVNALRGVIESTLERQESWLQEAAAEANKDFVCSYGIPVETIRTIISNTDLSKDKVVRRGNCLALGLIPYVKYGNKFTDVVDCLLAASTLDFKQQSQNDPEARAHSINSISTLVCSINIQDLSSYIPSPLFSNIRDVLMRGMEDYSTDSRGDVGSWVREACMNAFAAILASLDDKEALEKFVDGEFLKALIGAVLQQSLEKIDRVRATALRVLKSLLQLSSLPSGAHKERIMQALEREKEWIDTYALFGAFTPLLAIPTYRIPLLTGLVISAGGLTESLVKFSSAALIKFVESLPTREINVKDFLIAFEQLIYQRSKQDRIIIPLFDAFDLLFSSETFESIIAGAAENDQELPDIFLRLLIALRKEVLKSKDVKKLMAAIKVFCGFYALPVQKCRERSLSYLLTYLVHPFPRVRRFAAEQLYVSFTVLPVDTYSDMDGIELILLETDWDKPAAEIKPVRDQLFPLFGMPLPVSTTNSAVSLTNAEN